MRFCLVIILFSFFGHSYAQMNFGFDKTEALEMIRICNSHTFLELYRSDKEIIPQGYVRTYSSTPNVLDNMFQVYKRENTAVIHFRGSTTNPNSWIENLYSAMIPAQGSITVYSEKRPYRFAERKDAAVHSGFALAIVMMSNDILTQIKLLNAEGVYDILITGHSQGGALATMTHAYLENLSAGDISRRNRFKVYAFANPMCGNQSFAAEYDSRFSGRGKSFRIANPKDIVPSLPVTYSDKDLFSADNIIAWLTGEEEFDIKKLGIELVMRKFGDGLSAYIHKSNQTLHKLITKQAGEVILPDYVDDIKYVHVGELHKLNSFPYPEQIKDSTDIPTYELKNYQRLSNGKYQRKEPNFYQHKPYNYYVAFAKQYAESEYKKIRRKYLVENL